MEYVVGYIPSLDRTVIFKETGNEIEVSGWYFGEPDDELTREFANVGCVVKIM